MKIYRAGKKPHTLFFISFDKRADGLSTKVCVGRFSSGCEVVLVITMPNGRVVEFKGQDRTRRGAFKSLRRNLENYKSFFATLGINHKAPITNARIPNKQPSPF